MIGLAFFVALVAVLVAVATFLQSRSAKQIAFDRGAELEKHRHELESLKGNLVSLRVEAKERRDEASSLRAELNATKRKAFEQAEAAKRAGGAVALRTELDKLTSRLAEARAEAAHHLERAQGFEVSLQRQLKEIERLRAAAERKSEQKSAVASAPAAPAGPAGNTVDADKFEAEKARADKAEARATELRRRVSELEKDLKAARGRLETEKRVYMVQKGELELANDRYTELRRRYDGLRRDHEELVEAVKAAAQEDRRLAELERKSAAVAEKDVEKRAAIVDEEPPMKPAQVVSRPGDAKARAAKPSEPVKPEAEKTEGEKPAEEAKSTEGAGGPSAA